MAKLPISALILGSKQMCDELAPHAVHLLDRVQWTSLGRSGSGSVSVRPCLSPTVGCRNALASRRSRGEEVGLLYLQVCANCTPKVPGVDGTVAVTMCPITSVSVTS